jgi:hypothetical protein
MRQYLPLFLLMGLLTVANVSYTDSLYAHAGCVGNIGCLDAGEGRDVISVYKTDALEDVKFLVKRFTRCHDYKFS